MHELSLADAAVRICREHARGRRVARVELVVGALRQVVPESLAFAFELVADGTELEGAELAIRHVPARVVCRACGSADELDAFPLMCPRCGSFDVDVVAGEECHVEAIEIDEELVLTAAGGR